MERERATALEERCREVAVHGPRGGEAMQRLATLTRPIEVSLRSNHSGALWRGRGGDGLAGTALARKAEANQRSRLISTVRTIATFSIGLARDTHSSGTETEVRSQRGVCQYWGIAANAPWTNRSGQRE